MARTKRHPCEVTSDRLGDHYERYYDQMDGPERDELSHVRDVLERIAESVPDEDWQP
jgi:hypothetical protein